MNRNCKTHHDIMSISTVCIRVPLRSLLLERRGANKSGGVKLPTLKHLKQSNCLGIKKNVRRNSCILKVHNIGKQMFIRQKKSCKEASNLLWHAHGAGESSLKLPTSQVLS